MTHLANVLRILSLHLANSQLRRKFLDKLKKYLLGRGTRTASDRILEEVNFIKEMYDRGKKSDAVALMLAQKELKGKSVDHQDFFDEVLRHVYQKVVQNMYEYFKSPEVSEDPVSWRGVFQNSFEAAMGSADQFVQQSAQKNGLDEISEPEFWNTVMNEIEGMTR